MAMTVSRAAYAGMFGPTTGDRLRLADTELVTFAIIFAIGNS